ncbi:HD-GYP domain-containing protein [Pseudomonas argentinensis]|uniref:HDIG domain-containing protein n=1 Tax=Phytopseudomonas argentinensis TaxID=289370 RepID=A0A1I3PTQ2_9GAMM|nr:HD-GYP domain-containing protein [Pseudomonas argentinensis]KAB0546430.1 HD-GYP domain-containing protein [Pseudomonas argentinensis]SFJ24800.1 HDIG domain-containing protein [Pseudomonas argentinensis]
MLKKISTQAVRVGMFIQGFDGNWLSHPFWKSRFVIEDAEDLARVRQSGVSGVWIDTSKGLDVANQSGPAPAPEAAVPVAEPTVVAAVARCSVRDELQRAARLINRSKKAVTELFQEARLGNAINVEGCMPLVADISESLARNSSALLGLARLKHKDEYTYMHSVAVCALMLSLARQLGLDEEHAREAGLAGLLHDVGKMAMPLEVLNKPGSLSDAEFAVMRSHPERGHAMLRAAGSLPESALDVCLHHHEKYDGSGYPYGLAGENISLLARMGAVCDVYDAITSNRPYKHAWSPAESLARMAQWTGHFDTRVFHALVRTVGIYPLGSLVRLESGRLGVVVDLLPGKLTTPVVRVFFSAKSRAAIAQQEVDLSRPGANDRIVGREDPGEWGFSNLDDFWR